MITVYNNTDVPTSDTVGGPHNVYVNKYLVYLYPAATAPNIIPKFKKQSPASSVRKVFTFALS